VPVGLEMAQKPPLDLRCPHRLPSWGSCSSRNSSS
jgi:hypothetical protein